MSEQQGLGDAIAQTLEEVIEGVKRKWREANAQESLYDALVGFIHAINWKEPWIMGILTMHAMLILTALTTRRRGGLQACLFFFACGTIYLGERLNKLGSQYWEAFASQNYFDPNGVFYTALISGPLLLVNFIVLINYLRSCVQLLIVTKRKELKLRARQRRAAEQEGNSGGAETSSAGEAREEGGGASEHSGKKE